MTAAVALLILSTLALFAAIAALVGLFIVRSEQRSEESAADRAYRWREQMRSMSHGRRS